MPKTKISEFSATPANNTDIDSIFIGEGMAPSNVNDAIRELMAQLKDFQTGSAGDPVTVGGVLTVTAGAVGTPAITTAGDTNTGIFFPAADTIGFAEGGAEAMRIDSSGNLGLGVTPAVWNSGYKAIQFSNSGAVYGTTGDVSFGNNVYSNSSDVNTYITTAAASAYRQTSGQHLWYRAASGTAGTNVTFTNSMTLDASGNLCLNTTSSSPITTRISGNANGFIVAGATFPALCVQDTTNSTYFSHFSQNEADTYVWNTANGTMRFGTNDTERARITSDGNLLVGTTSANPAGRATNSRIAAIQAGGDTMTLQQPSNSYVNIVSHVTTTSGTRYHIAFGDGTSFGERGVISTNGSSTTYSTSSDYRLKNSIAPMIGALAKVALLKPCTYKWNTDGSDGEGFIAHELQAIIPSAVTGEKDSVDKNGNPKYQGIDTSFLVATLTAAIQELNTKFEAYKASHP